MGRGGDQAYCHINITIVLFYNANKYICYLPIQLNISYLSSNTQILLIMLSDQTE